MNWNKKTVATGFWKDVQFKYKNSGEQVFKTNLVCHKNP